MDKETIDSMVETLDGLLDVLPEGAQKRSLQFANSELKELYNRIKTLKDENNYSQEEVEITKKTADFLKQLVSSALNLLD